MKYLIVAAHPDDEVLGAGGTMFNLSSSGHEVHVAFMASEVEERNARPDDKKLRTDISESLAILGTSSIFYGGFPNIKMNTVPHLHCVQFVESIIEKIAPDFIITHHPNDLNNDHNHTSLAVQAASRLFQRGQVDPLNALLFMEVPSATDWALNTSMNFFSPNIFFHIAKEGLDKKISALDKYSGVMRPFPHPRSSEVITGLAACRGGQSGYEYAEAFELAFGRLSVKFRSL